MLIPLAAPPAPPPLDLVFHALADSARRRMVAQLSEGPASVTALAAPLPMSLPAVLQHLRVLEQSGLVRTEKRGRTRLCRLDPATLSAAEAWMAERRAFWSAALDRLESFLEDQEAEDQEKGNP